MAGPLERGTHDCLTTACAASLALWGCDPLAAGAPHYRSFTAAQRIVLRAGGILAWSRQAFEGAGMRLTDTPGPGDLALVSTSRAKGGATYALCIRPGQYAAKAADGLAIVQGNIIGAWAWE